jgi:sulfoxide reductase heme-binding subunit YedZ
MLSYVGLDYRFDFEPLIDDVLKKKFIFIGFSAWLLLIPLAITSSDKMVRILKKNWKKLHRLVYVISILGVIHFLWLVKKDLTEPLIYLLIIVILLILRVNFNRSESKIS